MAKYLGSYWRHVRIVSQLWQMPSSALDETAFIMLQRSSRKKEQDSVKRNELRELKRNARVVIMEAELVCPRAKLEWKMRRKWLRRATCEPLMNRANDTILTTKPTRTVITSSCAGWNVRSVVESCCAMVIKSARFLLKIWRKTMWEPRMNACWRASGCSLMFLALKCSTHNRAQQSLARNACEQLNLHPLHLDVFSPDSRNSP